MEALAIREPKESNSKLVAVPNEEHVHPEESARALATGRDPTVLLTMDLIRLSMMHPTK